MHGYAPHKHPCMRSLSGTTRQLIFPNALLVGAAAAALLIPATKTISPQTAFGVSAAAIASAALLALRFHSLRSFLLALGLAPAAVFLFRFTDGFQPGIVRMVFGLVLALDFAFLSFAEDAFDWSAVRWWSVLLVLEWTAAALLLRYQPQSLATLAATHTSLAQLNIVTAVFAFVLMMLFLRFLQAPDAISSGILWSAMATAIAAANTSSALLLLAVGGLVMSVSLVERSYWIAFHDELTGIPSRRALKEALASAGDDYCVAMVDVDHFKKFNDTYGHEIGDQVLRMVAAQLANVNRPARAFRFGGEEFAVVFPHTTLEDACAQADALRRAIESESFVVRGPDRSGRPRSERREHYRPRRRPQAEEANVTVSMGVAIATIELESSQVIAAADRALYKAKELGRNRVVASAPGNRAMREFTQRAAARQ
jgi:GGDEF domain-containing protein